MHVFNESDGISYSWLSLKDTASQQHRITNNSKIQVAMENYFLEEDAASKEEFNVLQEEMVLHAFLP